MIKKKNKHVLTKQNKIKIKAFLKLRKLASETLILGKKWEHNLLKYKI